MGYNHCRAWFMYLSQELIAMKRMNYAICMIFAVVCFGLIITPRFAAAHCDTLDGPVIKDAQMALEKEDIQPILKWVQKKDEAQVHAAFNQALTAGKRRASTGSSKPW